MPQGSTLDPIPNPPATPSPVPEAAVQEQLRRLLQSPLFSHSRRYPGFLQYVVDMTLQGRQNCLKERSIGIDVFQRNPDYDLNMDPVVRVTAGEVRKRLAQYYYESDHRDELRIEIHPGSYVPEFKRTEPSRPRSQRTVQEPLLKTPPAPEGPAHPFPTAAPAGRAAKPPLSQETAAAPARAVHSRRWGQALGAAALFAVAAVAVYFFLSSRRSDLDQFWRPALAAGSDPVLISVGSWGTTASNSSDLSVGTHAESVSPVALADTITIANLQQFLSERSRTARIQVSSQTTFSDLQHGATLLVSGFDNQWTMRLTAPLRFHFATRDGHLLSIEDRDNAGRAWQIDQNVPYSSLARDYAIIARFHDPTTEQIIVVAAGIGENGTIAAGQMLTNPQFFTSGRSAAWNASARNIEAVLETEVIDGKSGPPRIVAVTTW